jgi:hypothetical protein
MMMDFLILLSVFVGIFVLFSAGNIAEAIISYFEWLAIDFWFNSVITVVVVVITCVVVWVLVWGSIHFLWPILCWCGKVIPLLAKGYVHSMVK